MNRVSYQSSHDVLFATSPLQHWYLGAHFGNGVNVDAEVGCPLFSSPPPFWLCVGICTRGPCCVTEYGS
jgi:hypothetical protein